MQANPIIYNALLPFVLGFRGCLHRAPRQLFQMHR
jgi:hypothetical protein